MTLALARARIEATSSKSMHVVGEAVRQDYRSTIGWTVFDVGDPQGAVSTLLTGCSSITGHLVGALDEAGPGLQHHFD
jgi:hypothetical protein